MLDDVVVVVVAEATSDTHSQLIYFHPSYLSSLQLTPSTQHIRSMIKNSFLFRLFQTKYSSIHRLTVTEFAWWWRRAGRGWKSFEKSPQRENDKIDEAMNELEIHEKCKEKKKLTETKKKGFVSLFPHHLVETFDVTRTWKKPEKR